MQENALNAKTQDWISGVPKAMEYFFGIQELWDKTLFNPFFNRVSPLSV